MAKMLVHLTRMMNICVEVEAGDAGSAADMAAQHANGPLCDETCHEPTSEADGDYEVYQIDQMKIDPDTGLATGFETIAGMDADSEHGWVLKIAEGR